MSSDPVTTGLSQVMKDYDRGAIDALRSLAETFTVLGMTEAADLTRRAQRAVEEMP